MNNKSRQLAAVILVICVGVGLSTWLGPRTEMTGLRIACNDDAAGLLIKYLVEKERATLEAINMSYLELQDCCNSQAELALAAGNFDMAILCPDGAKKLISSGQPYKVLGTVVVNGQVLVTAQDAMPRTVGYMNAREIQKKLVWSNLDGNIEMKPMLPAGLPYALERKAVDGIVLDILGALKIGGYPTALPSDYPTSVLVVHRELLNSPELAGFVKVYNQAAAELNQPEILALEFERYLATENGLNEVRIWREMGVQFQPIDLPK